jgi:mycothiol synthase
MATLPAGYTLRAPTLADAAEVAAMINAASQAVAGHDRASVEDVLGSWEDPLRNLEDEDWLIIAPDGGIAGYLELYEYEPFTVFEFEGFVHPQHLGRGIGSVLLETVEARIRRGMQRSPDGERIVARTQTASEDTAAHALLTARGYDHIRNWRQMLLEFDGPTPEPAWPDGVRVRQFVQRQDERAVWETAEAAWEDHWGFSPLPFDEFIYYRIESQAAFDPTLWLIAEAADAPGTPIGVLLGQPERAGFDGAGWVAQLGVRREWRGRGIALALLRESFQEFQRRGYRAVGLNVDGSSLTGADRLYERAGMREIRREHVYEKAMSDG